MKFFITLICLFLKFGVFGSVRGENESGIVEDFVVKMVQNTTFNCYTCLYGTYDNNTREVFMRTLNIPPSDETEQCQDPFLVHDKYLGPCNSTCIKSIFVNEYYQIIIRGCLTRIYKQISQDFLSMRSGFAPSGDCDKQIQYDEAIGEIATTTCLCTGEKCNFSMAYRSANLLVLIVLLFIYSFFRQY